MKRIIVSALLLCGFLSFLYAQTDTLQLDATTVVAHKEDRQIKSTSLVADVVSSAFLEKNFTGNIIQSIGKLPGIQSMDIGSGFSKPMIRGMGFNRIAVAESGIKQEGQQWGADHGLEIDAFNVEGIRVLKGPASLLYGSDAMGGVIEIQPVSFKPQECRYAEVSLLGKSVNAGLGLSAMAGFSGRRWMVQARFSEQHFGDYRVPTDSIVYLTQILPIYGRKLKNTAGYDRSGSITAGFRSGIYKAFLTVSDAFEKTGFFEGAHGVPDKTRLYDDGDSRNIGLPFSKVNHLKISTRQQFSPGASIITVDLAYQNNDRSEWSSFHTHYGTQPRPAKNPDKEHAFVLHTLSGSVSWRIMHTARFEETFGMSGTWQENTISGYGFLLPEYRRSTAGAVWTATYKPDSRWTVTGGVRYDIGNIDIEGHFDPYLDAYLREHSTMSPAEIESYSNVSRAVDRSMGDYSASLGAIWTPRTGHTVKLNVGRCFRLPGANELSANGVHHGTFRHEQGGPQLNPEHGWQGDLSYRIEWSGFHVEVSGFASLYGNYIYLDPTGEWSVLPHAGQIYRYSQTKAEFLGGEIDAVLPICNGLDYSLSGEYVYTYNRNSSTALSFSPPATITNAITWHNRIADITAEMRTIAKQDRVSHNEQKTPGASVFGISVNREIGFGPVEAVISLSANNLLDKKYYNHLSFYRKIEVPEPGRNIQLSVKFRFNKNNYEKN